MEPADLRAERLHGLAAVDVVPTEDEDVLRVRGTVEDGGYRYDAGPVEVVEVAPGACVPHLHFAFGRRGQGNDRMQHQAPVRAACCADQRGTLPTLTGLVIDGTLWIDGHLQAAAG